MARVILERYPEPNNKVHAGSFKELPVRKVRGTTRRRRRRNFARIHHRCWVFKRVRLGDDKECACVGMEHPLVKNEVLTYAEGGGGESPPASTTGAGCLNACDFGTMNSASASA